MVKRVYDYVCKMCGLKADTRTCDYAYKPDQESIHFYCPICRDRTVMTPIEDKGNTDASLTPELKLTLKTVDNFNNSFYNVTTINSGLVLDNLEKHDDGGYSISFKKEDGATCYGLVTGCFETAKGYELIIEVDLWHTSIIVPPDNVAYEAVKGIYTYFQEKIEDTVNS